MMASLDSEVLKALIDFAKTAVGATCDSHSGLYCDDDSCANKVLPRAEEALDLVLKKHGITL